MSTLTTAISLSLRASLQGTGDFSTPTSEIVKAITDSLANGTGLDSANLVFADQRALAGSATENLDLSGALTNDLGETVVFARAKAILVELVTATAGYTLLVGGAASNQFATIFGDATDKLVVRGGGFALLWAPDVTAYAVTAATGDLLKIDNPNAGAITYNIIIIGASA